MYLQNLLLVLVVCCLSGGNGETSLAEHVNTAIEPRSLDESKHFDSNEEFETQAQTHLMYRQQQQQQHHQQHHQQQQQQQQPIYDYSQSEEDQEEPPRQMYQQTRQQTNNYLNSKNKNHPKTIKQSSEEESEEEEEPDRLSVLLAQSKFSCTGKTTGYYADESLKCEVFHYCQENHRHSWICPDGFTFHQIHLICMPPSNENICQQSSKFHIVNDYLYKPINLEEHQTKPNVTLRYSERYYPEHYYEQHHHHSQDGDGDDDDDDEIPRTRNHYHRQPIQIGFHQQQYGHQQTQQTQQHQHQQQQQQQQQRQQPQQVVRHQSQQVPQPQQPTTVYRRPAVYTTTHLPQLQSQPQIQVLRDPTQILLATPTPYRVYTGNTPLYQQQQHQKQQHQQQQQQQVFRTPEEINISLQQRRPQIYIGSTTPRYYEDEYLYERK